MAANDEGIRAIDQDEHNSDAHAKRVVQRYQDSSTGDWLNYDPSNGLTAGIAYDEMIGTSEDANGNPTVVTLKNDGATVATFSVTHNSSDKLTHITRTSP